MMTIESKHPMAEVLKIEEPRDPQFVLWVDAVGGFLVCLGDAITIGQATPTTRVDIAIQGDLSSKHAVIHRTGEDYIIEPFGSVRVDGKEVESQHLLADGDELHLNHVQLRFRKPHALSATARLEVVSRHRTQPYTDGVLLMAESCVLGPKWQNHVVCRDWEDDVVLYRKGEDLYCRTMGSFEIDGRTLDGRGRLTLDSHVAGEVFSMSLEEL